VKFSQENIWIWAIISNMQNSKQWGISLHIDYSNKNLILEFYANYTTINRITYNISYLFDENFHFIWWSYDENIGLKLFINDIIISNNDIDFYNTTWLYTWIWLWHHFYKYYNSETESSGFIRRYYFSGNIKNVKIYDRALSDQEIAQQVKITEF